MHFPQLDFVEFLVNWSTFWRNRAGVRLVLSFLLLGFIQFFVNWSALWKIRTGVWLIFHFPLLDIVQIPWKLVYSVENSNWGLAGFAFSAA